jgi:hypothetical protein
MLGGIVFQLVAIAVYMALMAHFYWSYRNNKSARSSLNATPRGELTPRLANLLGGLAMSTGYLFVR